MDYLAFSCHKMLAPFGVGVLVAKEQLLARSRPFLYGGDMIAEGQVAPDHVAYNDLPWKYAAGTPNILGVIVSAQALRLVLDLVHDDGRPWFGTSRALGFDAVDAAMRRVREHTHGLTATALDGLRSVDGLTVYGPGEAHGGRRWSRSTSPGSTRWTWPSGSTISVSRPGRAVTAPRWPTATSA